MSRRTERLARTRTQLVAAARRAFAEHGYAAASMDELTATAGLTRGALYHHFGDKRGLLQAVVDEIDGEMLARAQAVRDGASDAWTALLDESVAYIGMALDPEIRRIVLLDGPAVLGDPSRWPNQTACLRATADAIRALAADGTVDPVVDAEAAARLLNGAALDAALWVAAADDPGAVLGRASDAFRALARGLLAR